MEILILMVIMQFKHFIADYPLQTPYMLGKFKATGWVKPLLAHVGVHGVFTFIISLVMLWHTAGGLAIALGLALLDMSVHFIMDRIKASPTLLGQYKALSATEYMFAVNQIAQDEKMGVPIDRINTKRLDDNTYFWWALGLDQMIHHLTDIATVTILIHYT